MTVKAGKRKQNRKPRKVKGLAPTTAKGSPTPKNL